MGLFGKKKNQIKNDVPADDVYVPPASAPEDDAAVPVAAAAPSPAPMGGGAVGGSDAGKDALLGSSSHKADPMDPEEGDADLTVRTDYYKVGDNKKTLFQQVEERVTVWSAAFMSWWAGFPKTHQIAMAAGVAAVLLTLIIVTSNSAPLIPRNVAVAFVGNSYFYVNDLPRVMESMSNGHMYQDSVLHNSANILEIIMTGNGMWNKWATSEAMIGGVRYERSDGEVDYLYDMGACSVPQLLTGHDELVTSGNEAGAFLNDGENPCFQSDGYLEYQESFEYKKNWDFVVITDQAKRMAYDETRQEALTAFNYTYGPILKKKKITPVIVQPHSYVSGNGNNADGDAATFTDLATFTALVREGAYVYKKYMNQRLGWFTSAKIAPVGDAFLAVWEDDQDMHSKLFLDDGVHPSAYGTYLYGTVIYATMLGYMPKKSNVIVDDIEEKLFSTARRLQASSSSVGFPTKDELRYLYKIAKKVHNGYKPKSLKNINFDAEADEYLSSEVSDAEYEGDYVVDTYYDYNDNNNNNGQQYQGYEDFNDYYAYDEENQDDGQQYGYDENNAASDYSMYGGDYGYSGNYGANDANQYNGQYGADDANYNGQYGGNYGN
mmetsp:Transcript_22557/g.53303  ORF Transcript_22557/g.53303 Transcript_22557/m.53303 type:complete len:606 (+) Transcript_22557:229-2046(+)